MNLDENRLTSMLGEAVKCAWGDFPQPIQELLFEGALLAPEGESSFALRHELALLLHELHPRTAKRA